MEDCLFCKIAAGEIPCKKAYEDDTVLGFYDIDPKAPVHVLIIPKKHFTDMTELTEADSALLSHMFAAANSIAAELGVSKDGFRTVINTGKNGGQSVPHLHMHLLGGRELEWPPG